MRKIAPLKFEFIYLDTLDSKERLKRAYGRIFAIARQNIINKRMLKRN